MVCELSEGAVGDQVDRRIELASGGGQVGEQSRRSKVEKELSVVGIVKKREGGGCERGESLALDWEADIGDTLARR